MIYELGKLDFRKIESLNIKKGLLLVHPGLKDEATMIVKQWIAVIMARHYDKDPRKMIEANEYVLQYKGVTWFKPNQILLLTNK